MWAFPFLEGLMPDPNADPNIPPANAPGTPPPAHSSVYDQEPDPKAFGNKEYWKLLRDENAAQRLRRKAAEAEVQAAKEEAAKVAKDATEKISAAEKAAEARIIIAELKAAALKAGMVDLDGLKLADLSALKLTESGEVEGAEALMEEMKKAKPYLFGAPPSTTDPAKKPPKAAPEAKTAKDMTPEEWAKHKKENGLR